jgi:uncharacterized protein
MNLPPFIRVQGTGVVLSVKAQPRASRTEVAGLLGAELKIKVASPPVDGAANQALIEFLAETLGVSKRDVALVRGASSTHKQFAVAGIGAEAAAARLLG